MSTGKPTSYASAVQASSNTSSEHVSKGPATQQGGRSSQGSEKQTAPHPRRARSPPGSGTAYSAQQYSRREEHKPRTGSPDEDVYVLTLLTDERHHRSVTSLRAKYFPPKLNKLEAHIALFRALPASRLEEVREDVRALLLGGGGGGSAGTSEPFDIGATEVFRMRRGIGLRCSNGARLRAMHDALAAKWRPWLSEQDRRFSAPHYTLMNFVEDEAELAAALAAAERDLAAMGDASTGEVRGLSLFRYDKGFWRDRQDFPFAS